MGNPSYEKSYLPIRVHHSVTPPPAICKVKIYEAMFHASKLYECLLHFLILLCLKAVGRVFGSSSP